MTDIVRTYPRYPVSSCAQYYEQAGMILPKRLTSLPPHCQKPFKDYISARWEETTEPFSHLLTHTV